MTTPTGPKFDTTEEPLKGGKYVDGELVEQLETPEPPQPTVEPAAEDEDGVTDA